MKRLPLLPSVLAVSPWLGAMLFLLVPSSIETEPRVVPWVLYFIFLATGAIIVMRWARVWRGALEFALGLAALWLGLLNPTLEDVGDMIWLALAVAGIMWSYTLIHFLGLETNQGPRLTGSPYGLVARIVALRSFLVLVAAALLTILVASLPSKISQRVSTRWAASLDSGMVEIQAAVGFAFALFVLGARLLGASFSRQAVRSPDLERRPVTLDVSGR